MYPTSLLLVSLLAAILLNFLISFYKFYCLFYIDNYITDNYIPDNCRLISPMKIVLTFVSFYLILIYTSSSSYMTCLYIWDINSLAVISFANIFSHLLDCIFILLIISFAVEKLLSSTTSRLLFFLFLLTRDRSKKYCYNLCQTVFCLCFLVGDL